MAPLLAPKRYTVEYDTALVGSYASCNPDPADPTGATWICDCHGGGPCPAVGVMSIARFANSTGACGSRSVVWSASRLCHLRTRALRKAPALQFRFPFCVLRLTAEPSVCVACGLRPDPTRPPTLHTTAPIMITAK